MDRFDQEFDDFEKKFDKMFKGGMFIGALFAIAQLALLLLLIWGAYEGIMWLRDQ